VCKIKFQQKYETNSKLGKEDNAKKLGRRIPFANENLTRLRSEAQLINPKFPQPQPPPNATKP
jgi:hypothetical protein